MRSHNIRVFQHRIEGIYWKGRMNFCRVLIWLQSPFPLPPQLSKHLPNLSLSLSSLCRDLPVQADRRGRGEEPVKTTGKNLNFFPCIPFTYSISQWRTQYYTKTHHPLLCTDMYYMETWTCPYVHNSYIYNIHAHKHSCVWKLPRAVGERFLQVRKTWSENWGLQQSWDTAVWGDRYWILMSKTRICKRLKGPGIDSASLAVPTRQSGESIPGLLKRFTNLGSVVFQK